MIKVLINEEECSLEGISPHMMVLDFLREVRGDTGTKEGCASGDCGACTVVLGTADAGQMRYQSINSCITPIATLHGKQLLTVEHLKHEGRLHPVQQSMVDCHGSQCGFCTPGFIMSMFAYRKNHSAPERESIIEALGGNLCRCTGYRPILDAAVHMFESPMEDQFSLSEAEIVSLLESIAADKSGVELRDLENGKQFYAPQNSAELAGLLLQHPEAQLVAGGTDLSLEFTQFLKETEILVYTGRVTELLEVKETTGTLEIGAAASYSDSQQLLLDYYPDMRELLERFGSLQIRNQGTVGGNVANASPIGDMPPILLVLDAELELRRGDKSRRLPIEDFFIAYKKTALRESEFIERVIVPKPEPDLIFRVYKISKRLEDDISASCGAFALQIVDGVVTKARVAFGGMAEIPMRAAACERALSGQPLTETTIATAEAALADDFSPISDFRASAEYRLAVSQNMIRRLYLELSAPAEHVRVTSCA